MALVVAATGGSLLTNPVNPDFKNEYDHKYHYSANIKDMIVHGWVAPSADPAVGIWMISPSRIEHMGGGPEKQDLTVQVGPILLNMLHSGHYGTPVVFVAADQIEGDGHFLIPNVRPGSYYLFSYVGGVVGDHVLQQKVAVGSEGDKNVDVGTKVVRPPRKGPTIWSIGVPNRSFGEFFVPVLNPRSPWPYPNTGPDRWRNYGAWLTYKESYPESDPVFDIGSSDFSRDWYFVQCLRPRPHRTVIHELNFYVMDKCPFNAVIGLGWLKAHCLRTTWADNQFVVRDANKT
ncbi:hypothetical protein CBR_g27981 [Chara braunii]|uniref:Rhamnogalacturonan lyase domain-containing protein n=1 Tax=Chara braunii TaxID=69332 RepID=A0A388L8X8_CHABU|nr:hypothetical protein CBR_g27981 [Chara braunii]|eukprot:GBG78757.1 hypothetical protein CBR_g27981 [Chara braunii]